MLGIAAGLRLGYIEAAVLLTVHCAERMLDRTTVVVAFP
jgi:hypothetical protein